MASPCRQIKIFRAFDRWWVVLFHGCVVWCSLLRGSLCGSVLLGATVIWFPVWIIFLDVVWTVCVKFRILQDDVMARTFRNCNFGRGCVDVCSGGKSARHYSFHCWGILGQQNPFLRNGLLLTMIMTFQNILNKIDSKNNFWKTFTHFLSITLVIHPQENISYGYDEG